jgi:dienelactone hydrolase
MPPRPSTIKWINFMHKTYIPYSDLEISLEAFVAHEEGGKRPCVILCHAWAGRDAFICERAEWIASLGYVGFAVDLYGKGVLGRSKEENLALKQPFLDDRRFLLRRIRAAFDVVKALPHVDSARIAVLGFGFGGVAALDLARSGAELKGAISAYGHFSPPQEVVGIKAKVLALHGYEDRFVKAHEVAAFESEMNSAGVDWQLHIFGGAMHAFTNPHANDPEFGVLYHPSSAARAMSKIETFLKEIF